MSQSRQLDYAIPQSTIASLSSGEVVGVTDNPDQVIPQKKFHARIRHDYATLKKPASKESLQLVESPSPEVMRRNFPRIKMEARVIVEEEMDRIENTPGMIVIRKGG